jgi:hypothetical protein
MTNALRRTILFWTYQIRCKYSMVPGQIKQHRLSQQVGAASKCQPRAFLPAICCSRELSAAFLVTKEDSRLVARDITHGPTFVYPGFFSLKMTAAVHDSFTSNSSFSNSSLLEELLNAITDSIMEGFSFGFHNSHDGSVFAVGSEALVIRDAQYVVVEGSASLFALNVTSPTNIEHWEAAWYNHTINTIMSKVSHIHSNIISRDTFKVHFTCLNCTFSPLMLPRVTA